MVELRLVPAAITVWAAALLVLLSGSAAPAALAVLGVVTLLYLFRQPGQAVLVAAVGAATVLMTRARLAHAAATELGPDIVGRLHTAPRPTAAGGWILSVDVPGYPAELTVFADDIPGELHAGSTISMAATYSPADAPGVAGVVANAEIIGAAAPTGWDAIAAHVRTTFADSVTRHLDGDHRGLIPGMVLGDTALQSPADTQLYMDTGLSHLSAVSGSNVTIITTVAIMACRAFSLGPRMQVGAAAAALLGFVGLVGVEPSVLRAAVTGLVGLAAVLGSAHMEPVHALCLSVIALVLIDPDLAAAWGFALSVAATAGIVALTPLLTRPLARTRLPLLLVRSLAVAIAADVVTAPLVALMAGEISLVTVAANVLVSPATAPVTVLGLIAAAAALVADPLAGAVLHAIAPLTWWIHNCAVWLAGLPLVTVPADPLWVLLGYGWIIAAILAGKAWVMVVALLVVLVSYANAESPAPEIPLEELNTHVVATVEDAGTAPPGTQVIIVEDPTGAPANRPTVTTDGVPVLFPHRDGAVSLHTDGTQRAADGRF